MKAGIIGLTKTIAKQWGLQFGGRTSTVASGLILTRLTTANEEGVYVTTPDGGKVALGTPVQQTQWRKGGDSGETAYKDIHLGRPGTATEAAKSMLAIASPPFCM